MIGTVFIQLGLVLVIFVIGLILVNEIFPVGLKIAAGIMVIILCHLFFWVFVLSGPMRYQYGLRLMKIPSIACIGPEFIVFC